MAINLQKERVERLEREGHGLVSLAKKARISLEKAGLGELPQMGVVQVVDTSGSMRHLYRNGTIQRVVEKVLGLAAVLDDDGQVPTIYFDVNARRSEDVDLTNYTGFIDRTVDQNKLGGGTHYAKPIELLRTLRDGEPWVQSGPVKTAAMPRLVLFFTDGDAQDKEAARQMIREASREPMVFVFIGIGPEKFTFLDELDNLKGRFLDNATVVSIRDLTKISDDELYREMTKELKAWYKGAREFGIIADDPHAVRNDPALMAKITQRDQEAKAEMGGNGPAAPGAKKGFLKRLGF